MKTTDPTGGLGCTMNGAQEAMVEILSNTFRACRRHPIGANMSRIQQRLSVTHEVITYMEEETCLILVAS